ncbi:dUTP diphosphatase [Microthyrium microscopicum]|uniref:Deoxyuridine 5'-triphosphate nucleotidohydrolase n=1 Tax=Microthyrium microscopicum TaxID=703497 RepID=A0A6A6UPL4_9PEZI|nr:dUTP diphosphatase [Microthyrium microscopicum]
MATPLPNLIHDPPSLPSSPHHKKTKVIDPVALALAESSGRETPTPIAMASNTLQNSTNSLGPLQVQLLSAKGRAPTRGSAYAAGYDIYSSTDIVVPGRGKAVVDTDMSIAVPEGTYGRIAPRSGLAAKHSIDTLAGVIDADYRGPVKVLLANLSDVDFEIKEGDRIAQLIIERIYTPDVAVVEKLPDTVRGAGGFGSTGGFGAKITAPTTEGAPTA